MAPTSQQDQKKKNLENAEWYHGFRPRKDANRLVSEPGEFLVRATDTGPATDIVITACDDNRKKVNLTLRFDGTNWFIAQNNPKHPVKNKYPTIVELVEHYRAHPPSKHLKLSKAVARPDWMLKHENVIYEEKDKLGAGNFCSVYKGVLKRAADKLNVAVKISLVAANATDAETEEAKEARKSMMHEAQIMSYYTHEHVIAFHGVACDHPPVLVIMEFCAGGDLLSHLIKHGKQTDEREKMVYLFEGSRGMLFLHGKKCVHRDLAARNCLISSSGKIKIADFGLSKLIDEGDNEGEGANSSNAQVPVRWMAPETLRKPAVYSMRSDVWAFGVMAYEIFNNGVKPWPEDPVKYVATQIRKGNMPKMPDSTPAKVIDLVSRMWNKEPDQRPGMRLIARELFAVIKEQSSSGTLKNDKLTINKIKGVTRESYFEFDDSSEFEESSGSTIENEHADKIDKSGVKRSRGSKGAPGRKCSSTREKASVDK